MNESYVFYICIFLLTLALTVLIEKKLIPFLSNRAKQPIYTEGPSWHVNKSGTPTMGGLAFLIAIGSSMLVSSLMLLQKDLQAGISLVISLIYCVGNALIGIFDDITKLRRKENAGLTPTQKLVLQSILAVIFLMARAHYFNDATSIKFSFGKIELGFFYYVLTFILLLGVVNCANLTDGVDGLSASVSATICIIFLIIGYTHTDTIIISILTIGGALGFLLFNANPAKIFMGDTGSLFLGALAACLAFSINNPFVIVFIGGVYVIEGLSVIMQVITFKLTGKRLFKMAPLHHHLEKSGIDENKICVLAVLSTLVLSTLAFLLRW